MAAQIEQQQETEFAMETEVEETAGPVPISKLEVSVAHGLAGSAY